MGVLGSFLACLFLSFTCIHTGRAALQSNEISSLPKLVPHLQEDYNEQAARFGSFPPPDTNITLSSRPERVSCTCKQILVSSLGEAQHVQHDTMGVYKYYNKYNGYPSYYGPSGKRLYYLIGSGWLIGPTLGNLTGYVHNGNHYQCPYLIPNGWMYVNSGYWYNDDTLIVRCIL